MVGALLRDLTKVGAWAARKETNELKKAGKQLFPCRKGMDRF